MQSPVALSALKRIAGGRFRDSDDGQDLLEYGLLVALIAVIALGAVSAAGNALTSVFWNVIANNF